MSARVLTAVRARGLVATLGSAALLGGALAFQVFGGLTPCEMCIWQRWPHGIAIALGLAVILTGSRRLAGLAAVVLAVSAGLGLFHAGVEQGWWQGPMACTSSGVEGMSTNDLMAQIMAAPLVRCDEIAWSFLDLSMAAWNGVFSAVLVLVWLSAARARR
ncbi:disulfide bond formation protein B [Paroceanicella profunda]|uniref:Disulfide bond formation protein B n=1 Tax=Paroceanicella profunda TaxID=2579971 RepID=A0A5B8FQ96_9RHOB|nr:disulfide bond formation protein B [Paroceanicella profunda]QDL90776.1 disulfide bond formation protein B [Paroceanicella profunda]